MIDLSSFTDTIVLCVGDVILDRFVSGDVKRISPESPVPVLLATGEQTLPGGAANVGRNVVSLGGKCILVGVIGDDAAGRELTNILAEGDGIDPDMVTVSARPTAEKTRFVSQGQHLLRLDREKTHSLSVEAEDAVIGAAARHIAGCHALVLSDYAKGALTDRVIIETIALAKNIGVPVVVDPKSPNLSRYDGATVVTPNMSETVAAVGLSPVTDALAEEAGRIALRDAALDSILITRAEHGMTLVPRDEGATHLKACAREVFDVVGAGDTVVATLALALGSRRPLEESARLANVAAGLVVGKRGTATVSRSELLDELGRISLHQEDWGTAGNNFIGAAPGHPVIEEALKNAIVSINRGDSDVVWLATGPGLLSRTLARYLAEGSAERFQRTLFLDLHELRRAVALHSTVAYKYSPRHWSRSVFHRRQTEATAQIAEIAARVSEK